MLQFIVWVVGFTFFFAAVGILYHAWGTRKDSRLHPPPGRLVDLGTHRLHLVECGSGGPTVLLEAGLMSTVLSWSELQSTLATSFRVASYDRAGLGWSEPGPMPRTADRIVDELHTLLQRAAIPPPYVLVGHSFGGLTMPLFAARFPDEVAGMVLVDPVVPAEWNPPSQRDLKLTRIGATVCRRAAFLARLGVIRFVAFLLTTRVKDLAAYLVQLISRGTPADSGTVSSPWFAALPANERAMASVFWVQAKFALSIASQLENLPISAASVAQYSNFSDKPVIIFSAGTAPERRLKEHANIAACLPQGEHVVAGNSNHWIMQEDPALLIRAVEKVLKSTEKTLSQTAPSSTVDRI